MKKMFAILVVMVVMAGVGWGGPTPGAGGLPASPVGGSIGGISAGTITFPSPAPVTTIPPTSPYNQMNIQGRLTDASGNPVPAGGYRATFKIYESSSVVYTDAETVLSVDANGVFNYTLGKITPIGIIFDPSKYYSVGITIGADLTRLRAAAEMTPQQPIVAVPFAVTSRHLIGGDVNANKISAKSTVVENDDALATAIVGNSATGNGIYGASTGDPSGTNPWYGIGVFGVSKTSTFIPAEQTGMFGTIPIKMYSAAVVGEGKGAVGVTGLSNDNFGVYGRSMGTATSTDPSLGAGVYGINAQTTIPSGRVAAVGVFGETKANGIGVYGKSASIGIFGSSTSSTYTLPWFYVPFGAVAGMGDGLAGMSGYSLQNYGVCGISAASDKAGVLAGNVNASPGPAIEIGGKIKIQTAAEGTSAAPAAIAAGTFQIAATDTWKPVYNKFVTADSIVLLTINAYDLYGSTTVPVKNIYVYEKNPGNSFSVGFERVRAAWTKVGYLIIN